jgi:hypothetical protein
MPIRSGQNKDIADDMVGFYNSIRLHLKPGYPSLNIYRHWVTEK